MSNINDKCGGILGEMIFYFYSKNSKKFQTSFFKQKSPVFGAF